MPIWFPWVALAMLGVIAVFVAILWVGQNPRRFSRPLGEAVEILRAGQVRVEKEMRDEAARGREETARRLHAFGESTSASVSRLAQLQHDRLEAFAGQISRLSEANEQRLDRLRETVEKQLAALQSENTKKLEEMRRTVDEKLQGTLERRLGESFRHVSERLEQVHKGLGEMQSLATGVGDLKRVLTNVKVRGTWGEVQLETLLEQVLGPGQFSKNVATRPGSAERVEFCINLPGRNPDLDEVVWLPIDAKFPQEDYERLVECQQRGDNPGVSEALRQLENRIKASAKDIRDKYLNPPHTTDFAILFLPTEGLYAEAVRRAGLVEALQRDHRVVVAGPTTLGALLNSLQMGFRTLAIEQRSSEVWKTLGAVKNEFGKFGGIIDKVQKKLQAASNEMDRARSKTKTIERKLRNVEALPAHETTRLLDTAAIDVDAAPTALHEDGEEDLAPADRDEA